MTAHRTITICDKPVPLTEREVKSRTDGRTYFAFGSNGGFGSPVPALATSLPTLVQYEGQDFVLTPGLTTDGRKKVSGVGPIVFDESSDPIEHRNLTVSISETKTEGVWNLKASVTRIGTGGGGRQVVDIDSLWANLA